MIPVVRRMSGRGGWSLAAQLFALQAALIVLVLGGVGALTYLQVRDTNTTETAEEMLGIAHTLALVPEVREAHRLPDPTAVLQPLVEQVRLDTATDFIVVMTPDGIRWTHPDTTQIGQVFRGTIAPAAAGDDQFTETYAGTLGPSVRAVVPVRDDAGRVVALVSVGRTLTVIAQELERRVPLLLAGAGAALVITGAGSYALSRWLRRSTHDMGPRQLARMYEYYDAVLHAVREGLVLLDRDARVQLVNDEARRLLALPADVSGRRVDALGLPGPLAAALADGRDRTDEIHLTAERIVVVNQAPARWAGRDLGTVVTLRDHTELRALSSELETIRGFADSLGAQAHEAANHLHTVVSLIELGRGEDALDYATAELELTQAFTDTVLRAIAVPELAALVVGKQAQAAGRGVELRLAGTARVPDGVADPRDLITVVGNLLDNAVDAALEAPGPRWVRLDAAADAEGLLISVSDSGPGLPDDAVDLAFTSGWSTKPHSARLGGLGRGLGLALVSRAVHRYGGSVRVVRADGGGAEFRVRLPGG